MADYNHTYIGTLVKRAKRKDSDAFAELYVLTYEQIYNYCMRYLRDEFLAQDAVQEIYMLALKNISEILDGTLFVAWLNRIAFRTCFDICKKRNKDYDLIDIETLELIKEDENSSLNPEASFVTASESELLNKAIDSLPFLEEQVIVMKYYNDMKLEDIAKALHVSRSSVKRYLASARDKLKAIIRREGRED